MGQSCSSILCLGETDDVVLTNSNQRQNPRMLLSSQQQQQQQNRAGSHFGKKKGQKKRGGLNGTLAADCADPKMFNLMSQSLLQQQMLRQQQQQQWQPQSLPSTASTQSSSKSQPASASNASLGGQTHLLYRKHPKSILALTGSSSSSAQPSNGLLPMSSSTTPPWGALPRRNIPTKLIVRRPRRGTFPLSYQDEGLSGTQIYAMRYWVKNSDGKANDCNVRETQYSTLGRGQLDDEEHSNYAGKEEDQDCIWMIMQDEEDDEDDAEDDEMIQQRRRQRHQEQYPGGRKNMGSKQSNATKSLSATTDALPTLLPLYHAKSGGSFGYSTNVPSYAFRDLERNQRMRQPSTTISGDETDVLVTAAGSADTADSTDNPMSNATITDGSSKTASTSSTVIRRTPLGEPIGSASSSNWTTSAIGSSSAALTSAPSTWSTPNPSAVASAAAVPTGDFFTPQALATHQPRQVLDWVTISEEYNIHVADVGLTPAECDHLVQVTEQVCRGQYAAYTYAKQTLGCREYPTLAQACVEPVHAVVEAIRTYTTLHPHNSSAYFGCTNLQLDDREPHMVKYDVTKKERQKLDMHTDKSEWTFLIALSNGGGLDYDGGGTFFECLDATVHVQRGHALIFPGKLRHCGQRITTGLRFILVGFLVDKPMLPLNGTPATASNLATSARCSGPMAIPPDHHRA